MAFRTSHNQGRESHLTSRKWVQISKFDVFSHTFRQKTLKVCYKVSLSKKFQRQSCSAINYLSNVINILAGHDPVPVKFGPKGIDPNRKDARFTFHTRSAVQSATPDLLVNIRSSILNVYDLRFVFCVLCVLSFDRITDDNDFSTSLVG